MNNTGIFFKDFQNELLQQAANADSIALYKVDSKEAFKSFDMTDPVGTCSTDAASIPLGSVVKYAVDGSKLTACFYIPDGSYDSHECIRVFDYGEIQTFSCKSYLDGLNENTVESIECTEYTSLEEIAVEYGLIDEDYDEDCGDDDYDDDEEEEDDDEYEDDYDFRDDLDPDIIDAWEAADGGSIWEVTYNDDHSEWLPDCDFDAEELGHEALSGHSQVECMLTMDDDKESLEQLENYSGNCADEVKQAIVDIIARHHLES